MMRIIWVTIERNGRDPLFYSEQNEKNKGASQVEVTVAAVVVLFPL